MFKKITVVGLIIVILATMLCFTTSAADIKPSGIEVVSYDSTIDYMAKMLECAKDGSKYALMMGAIYEQQRNMKIQNEGITKYAQTNFFEAYDADQIVAQLREYNNIGKPVVTPKPTVQYYTEDEVIMLAKLLFTECRGVPSVTEQACVAWTVCNRVDAGYASTITGVITAPYAYAYYSSTPVDSDLYELAKDVLERWNREKNGETDVGRVLPADYYYFNGSGGHNWFRNWYSGGSSYWDYSLPSPYAS